MRDFIDIFIRTLFSKDQPPLTPGEQEAILKFRGLGVYDATKHLNHAVTLGACAATTDQVNAYARISAQAALFHSNVQELEQAGIYIQTQPLEEN